MKDTTGLLGQWPWLGASSSLSLSRSTDLIVIDLPEGVNVVAGTGKYNRLAIMKRGRLGYLKTEVAWRLSSSMQSMLTGSLILWADSVAETEPEHICC